MFSSILRSPALNRLTSLGHPNPNSHPPSTLSLLRDLNSQLSACTTLPTDPSERVQLLVELTKLKGTVSGVLLAHASEIDSLLSQPTPPTPIPAPSCPPAPTDTPVHRPEVPVAAPSAPPARALFLPSPSSDSPIPPPPPPPRPAHSERPPSPVPFPRRGTPWSPYPTLPSSDAQTLANIQARLAFDYAANANRVAISGTPEQIRQACAALGPTDFDIRVYLSNFVYGLSNIISVDIRPSLITVTLRTKALARRLLVALRSTKPPADFVASGVCVRPALSRLQRAYKALVYGIASDDQSGVHEPPLIFWDGHMGFYRYRPILPQPEWVLTLSKHLKFS